LIDVEFGAEVSAWPTYSTYVRGVIRGVLLTGRHDGALVIEG
jgi:hypothetical protein